MDVRLTAILHHLLTTDSSTTRGLAYAPNELAAGQYSAASTSTPAAGGVAEEDGDEGDDGPYYPRVAVLALDAALPRLAEGGVAAAGDTVDLAEVARRVCRRLYASTEAFAADIRRLITPVIAALPSAAVSHRDAVVVRGQLNRALRQTASMEGAGDDGGGGGGGGGGGAASGSSGAGGGASANSGGIPGLVNASRELPSRDGEAARSFAPVSLSATVGGGGRRRREGGTPGAKRSRATMEGDGGGGDGGEREARQLPPAAAAARLADVPPTAAPVGHVRCATCGDLFAVVALGSEVALPMPVAAGGEDAAAGDDEVWHTYPWLCPRCLYSGGAALTLLAAQEVDLFVLPSLAWRRMRVVAFDATTGRYLVTTVAAPPRPHGSASADFTQLLPWCYVDLARAYIRAVPFPGAPPPAAMPCGAAPPPGHF